MIKYKQQQQKKKEIRKQEKHDYHDYALREKEKVCQLFKEKQKCPLNWNTEHLFGQQAKKERKKNNQKNKTRNQESVKAWKQEKQTLPERENMMALPSE